MGLMSLRQFTLAGFAMAQFAVANSLVAQFGVCLVEGQGQLVLKFTELL